MLVERRLKLISLGKTRKLSVAESNELKTILLEELRHDFDAGKIGFIAFLILVAIIENLAKALEAVV